MSAPLSPSPTSHVYLVISPSGSSDADASKDTDNGAVPSLADIVKLAVGDSPVVVVLSLLLLSLQLI